MVARARRRIGLRVRRVISDWRIWRLRFLVLAISAVAGLLVVAFTVLSEKALDLFFHVRSISPWLPFVWTPCITALVVWLTRRFAPEAAGSGIPQVIATLDPRVPQVQIGRLVSLRMSGAKVLLTALGLSGGLSLGREGPSVQIAAGVLHSLRRWIPSRSEITPYGLMVAGGSAGIAAAFNTPLAGVMFAIEELTRRPEQRSSGLLLAGIVVAGMMAVAIMGNSTYFGVIYAPPYEVAMLLPALAVAVACGLAGGLFSRLLVVSLDPASPHPLNRWRAGRPVWFAFMCGLSVAIIGWVSDGTAQGSGYAYTRAMLDGARLSMPTDGLMKFTATWLTAWSGAPGGILAPSLSIGATLGRDVAAALGHVQAPIFIALGMAGFLAAVTRAPLTSFIIVMEMVDGHAMVLSLMACAFVSSALARPITPPLYRTLAEFQIRRICHGSIPPEMAGASKKNGARGHRAPKNKSVETA